MFNLKAGNQRQTKTLPFVREPASLPEYSPGWILDNCSSISRGVRGWSEMADVRGRIMKQTGLFRGAEETDRATGPPEQSGASVWALAGRGIANLRDPTLRWKLLNSEYFHSEYQMSGCLNEEPRALSGHFDRCSTVQVSGCRAVDLTASRGFCPNLAETLWRAAQSNAGY